MALIIADRVKETSTSTSTGDFTLNGAVNGFQSFSGGIGVGNTCYYVIEDLNAGDWEVGIGTLTGSTTLQRTTVLKSSNSNNAVNFGSGEKSVFVTAAADQIADLVTKTNNTAQTITGSADFDVNITDTTDSTQVLISYIDGFQADNILTSTSEQSFVYAKYGIASLGANNSGATQAALLSVAKDNVELTYTGSYTQTSDSLLPRGLMDLRYAQFNSTMTGTWNGTVIAGQYGGTGVANTGKTITLGGNLTTSGAYACTLTLTNTTNVTLPTTGTIAATDSTMTGTWNGTAIAGQYGGTGVANTGKTITLGGNFTTSGAYACTLTLTNTTNVTLPTTGTIAATDSTMTGTWNGTVIAGQYGGTGVANTGKTITLGGNLTTSGAFACTFTLTNTTSVTLPTSGTIAATNSTMTGTWNGTVIAGQYGGTGVANTGKTITLGGNLTTSGAFACTFTLSNTTSITLPTTGTVATLAGAETFSSKFITLSAGTTSVAPLVFTGGTNKTTPSAGCMEFSGSVLYFTPSTTRKTIAFTDSTMTGVWNGTAISLTYGGTGATTQAGAANAVLPSQTGNSGKYLTTDGSNVSWATVSAGLTVTDDTSTNASRYITFTSATSGSISGFNTSSTRLTFNPSTGDLFVWGNVTANSDRRLKKNIETIRDASAKVRALNGVEFDWIEDDSHSLGLIAQDVEQVAPDLVVTSDLGYKSVNYGNLVGLLVEAIKDLQDEVSALKKQLGGS